MLWHTTPQNKYGQMQKSGIPYLHSSTSLLNPHSLTVQSTPYSLTKIMFTGGHTCNFPSILPSIHHSSYIILIILFYDHISSGQFGHVHKSKKCIRLQLIFLALGLYRNHEHVLGVCVRVHAYKRRLSSIFVCIHQG